MPINERSASSPLAARPVRPQAHPAAFAAAWSDSRRAGNKTRIEYHIEAGSAHWLLTLGWLFVALGLAAILIGVGLEFAFVIPSPQPAIRAQAFQMFQAVHLVWPPFLFASLSRQPLKIIRSQFEALINNLPYL